MVLLGISIHMRFLFYVSNGCLFFCYRNWLGEALWGCHEDTVDRKRYWMLAMTSQSYILHIHKCIGSLLNDVIHSVVVMEIYPSNQHQLSSHIVQKASFGRCRNIMDRTRDIFNIALAVLNFTSFRIITSVILFHSQFHL